MSRWREESGQALPLVAGLAVVIAVIVTAVVQLALAGLASAQAQTAADLAALAAARELVRQSAFLGDPDPHADPEVERAVFDRAWPVARSSGARTAELTLPAPDHWPPTAARVEVSLPGPLGTQVRAKAVAAVVATEDGPWTGGSGGGYSGPLVRRDGKPMCPAVAAAYDRMAAEARQDGIALVVTSGYRSDAEQRELFRRRPDPRWVAPPGRSRHRDATELDINGPGAWEWLKRRAPQFGFVQRYFWEPWHWGYARGCEDDSVTRDVPTWVPLPFRQLVREASATHGLPAPLLAALLRAESGFDPRAVSPVGARGIAQFMPDTARAVGLRDPLDPAQAIHAAAELLAAHRERFGSTKLALAAYNAGPGAVAQFGGVPPYTETHDYIARIMAMSGEFPTYPSVRLVKDLPGSRS